MTEPSPPRAAWAVMAGTPEDAAIKSYSGLVYGHGDRLLHACLHRHNDTDAAVRCAARWIEWLPKTPTDGFMRSMLDLFGHPTRGQKMTAAQLVKLCRSYGLPFKESGER